MATNVRVMHGNALDCLSVRWVTARELARLTGLGQQTLANWRLLDRRAGYEGGRPGYPVWRRFGGAIRYKVKPNGEPEIAA